MLGMRCGSRLQQGRSNWWCRESQNSRQPWREASLTSKIRPVLHLVAGLLPDTVIILVPHVCDGITVKSSADVNKDTVQDGQGLPNTEDMMQISGHIIPDQMESGNESHSSNSITPTLKQLVFSQINFGAVHMQFSGPWHQVPVYWAFPCSSGYSWDVPHGSCSSLKSKESSTMSWFQFCPAGKAQLYSYDAVHIQWDIAWSTTTLAYSIQYGCVTF